MKFIMVFSLYPIIGLASPVSSGLSIEPAVMHASIDPGSSFSSSFTVRNLEGVPLSISLRVVDFDPDSNGVGVQEKNQKTSSIDPLYASGWVAFPKEVLTVASRKTLSVPFTISVPIDAVPGGKSLAFVVETAGGNVHSRIYVLCFLNIPGNAEEKLTIEDLSFSSFIHNHPNSVLSVRLKNNGQTHLRPDGVIVVRNMFGAERGRYLLVHSDAIGTLVPGARRTIEYRWRRNSSLLDFGFWNARITLTYGNGGVHETSERAFFLLFPLLSVLLSLGISIFSFFLIRRSVRLAREEVKKYSKIPFSESSETIIEKRTSMRLLLIPLVAGVLLVSILAVTIISLFGKQDEGSIERVQKIQATELHTD